MLHAPHVGEAQVDEFDLVVGDEFFVVVGGHVGLGLERGMPVLEQAACQVEYHASH
jgi:hypothetical protein